MIKNIYCPKCLESDGLNPALEDMVCPLCHTEFIFFKNGLMEKLNDQYHFAICPHCNGREVTRTFAVPDGHGCIDWDSETWCENKDCPSNKLVDTCTEFGLIKPEENNKEVKIH